MRRPAATLPLESQGLREVEIAFSWPEPAVAQPCDSTAERTSRGVAAAEDCNMVAAPCLASKRSRPWGTLKILLRPPGRWQASAALGLHEGAEDNAYGHESNRPRLAAPSRSCTLAAAGFGGNEGAPEEPQRGPSRAHFRPPRRHRFRQNAVLISDCQILAFSRCAPFSQTHL